MNTFEITQKPIRTLMTVEDVEVVVGTKYPIALESTVKLNNSTGYYGEPFDSFKYKINKDTLNSVNTGTVIVNFETNKVGLPPIVNEVKTLEINDSFLLDEIISPEEHFDRIIITSISGKGSWLYKTNPLVVGQIIFYYDLVNNIRFFANQSGAQDNYSILTFDTMNSAGTHGQINTLTVNTFSIGGEIILEEFTPYPDTSEGNEILIYFFVIKKGIPNASYLLEINPALFPSLGINHLDSIKLYEGPDSIFTQVDEAGLTNFTSNLNEFGETSFMVKIYKDTDTIVENSVAISLKEIDSLSMNVNVLYNQIILLIPTTPTL